MEARGQCLLPSVKPFGKGALRNSGDDESIVCQCFVAVEAFAEHRYHCLSEHPARFGRYSRHRHQHVTALFPHHYGRCAVDILYHRACIGHESLIFGQGVELAAFGGKNTLNISRYLRVSPQASAKDVHQCSLSDIVFGRSEAAGGDYDIGGSHSAVYCRGDVGGDVAYDFNSDNGDAQRIKTAGNVARIGVGDASQQDFVADDYDVCFH